MKRDSLTMYFGTDCFSFFISNGKQRSGEIETYHVNPSISLTANLREAFSKLDFLNQKYDTVDVLTNSPHTLVPLDMFDDDIAPKVYKYNFPTLENRLVKYEVLPYANAVLVFSIDKNAHQFIAERMPEARFHGWMSASINHFAERSRHTDKSIMLVQMTNNKTEVTAYKQGRIIYANSFTETNEADRLYYILGAWKQAKMDQQTDELYTTFVTAQAELANNLKEFIAHIGNLDENCDINAYGFEAAPYYIKTFNTCGV
ncbi:MAG: DUF3822 family protein [Bacteroidaceae bacterium]|nr:DUF3822 family protein [Bacteroidaceae bacterium]